MDTDFNYLYEDKYYENAVKNLKSTFYDVVEREEIMLNNLENRIAQETDDGVKARLLDLWSKQNDSLDRSIVMFRQLKQSVRVIDSFVQELSEIDKAIVSDIINKTNNIRTTRVAQMEQQDIMEQPVEEQVQETTPEEVVVEEPVEEQVQEVAPEEVVVVEPVEEQVQEVAPEEVVEEPVEEQVQETIPEEVVEEPVEEQVQEVAPEEVVVEEPVEEQVQETIPEEVVEEPVEEQVQETAPEEKEVVETDNNNNNEEIKDPVEEEISMDLPLIESPEENNPQESVEKVESEEEKEEENKPLIPIDEEKIEVDNKEEEISEPLIPIDESTDLENVSIETNDTNEESTEEEQILENVEEKEDEIHFDESFNTDEVPEMEIVNEENDGMDLPNVVEADKIDYSAIDEEENKEEITNDEVVEIPNKKSEENISEDIDKVDISYIGKEDSDNPKAIIVTEGQFEKLNNSLETQENKLYNRGYLSSEIVNNTNYTLGKNTNNNEHDDQLDSMLDNDSISISENPTREEMEELIEKAAELYKSGKKHEAQALYEEISRINDEMHQDKGPELVKAA